VLDHHVDAFPFPLGGRKVGIDDYLAQEAEASGVTPGHQHRLVRPPANDERALDDCAELPPVTLLLASTSANARRSGVSR
jgi:hypothetical protein